MSIIRVNLRYKLIKNYQHKLVMSMNLLKLIRPNSRFIRAKKNYI